MTLKGHRRSPAMESPYMVSC